MKSRLEPSAANTATARTLACLIYYLLATGRETETEVEESASPSFVEM